jgi:hypothetical protein
VNGWVDYANHSLRYASWTTTYNAIAQDDFDTIYEWVAEDWFDLENAIPEQEGDSDNTGKIVDIKIFFGNKQPALASLLILDKANPECCFILQQWNNLPVSIWDPPPNRCKLFYS